MFFCSGRHRIQAENTQSPTRFFMSFVSARHALWQFFFFFNKCKYVLVQRKHRAQNREWHISQTAPTVRYYTLSPAVAAASVGGPTLFWQFQDECSTVTQLKRGVAARLSFRERRHPRRCVNSFTAQLYWERWSASGNGSRWMIHLILFKNIMAGIIVFDRLRCLHVSGISF